MITLDDLSVPAPDPGPHDWSEDGVVPLDGVIPADKIAAYQDEWMVANGWRGLKAAFAEAGDGQWELRGDPDRLFVVDADRPGGWPDACPYVYNPAMLDLLMGAELAAALEETVGEPMGLHLALTGWTSTQRNWHQDGYLNPDHVGDAYAAVWIALGDVEPDAGPFQFIPGSHRWHRLTNSRVAASGIVDMSDPAWPAQTEEVLTPLVEAEIVDRTAEVIDWLPNPGDALLWHPRLYHRGSAPRFPNTYRPALIAHFSGIRTRKDFGRAGWHPVQHEAGGWYWPIRTDQPVGSK